MGRRHWLLEAIPSLRVVMKYSEDIVMERGGGKRIKPKLIELESVVLSCLKEKLFFKKKTKQTKKLEGNGVIFSEVYE